MDFISLKCNWPCGTAFPAVGVVYAMEAPNTIDFKQVQAILQDPSPLASIITTNTSGSSDI